MQKIAQVLVVVADSIEREGLALAIELGRHRCETVASLQEAVSLLGKGSFDLVVTDCKTARSEPGAIVKKLKEACPSLRVMVLSHSKMEQSSEGADYWVVIPCSPKELEDRIRRAVSGKSYRITPRKFFENKVVGGKPLIARSGKRASTSAGFRT